MNLSKKQIQTYLGTKALISYQEQKLWSTVQAAKTAFYESEANAPLTRLEFLYQQSLYIRKHWWALQAGILLLLWLTLEFSGSDSFLPKSMMGASAPLFALLILPELWKNRSANALEIECTACYSLRQIYGARIFLFALVDFLLLGIFSLTAVGTGKLPAEDLIIQFILPYLVTCCICFHTLYSRRINSEAFAVFLCMVWYFLWMGFLLNETIYQAITLPLWLVMTIIAALYLGYCIRAGQKSCKTIWEVKTQWN